MEASRPYSHQTTVLLANLGVQDGSSSAGNSAEDSPSPASAAKDGGKVRESPVRMTPLQCSCCFPRMGDATA